MCGLPDPRLSRAVIIGTGEYRLLPALAPAVHNNVGALADALCDGDIWGLPRDHCLVAEDPEEPADMLDLARQASREATDTLVVYYAGHGLVDSRRVELHLCLTGSDAERIYTAVPYEHIRAAMLDSRARRKVVILDCCYGARAFGQMSGAGAAIAQEAAAEGTYVIAAAAENKQAIAPPGDRHTAFSGELLDILGNGLPHRGPTLTLDDIFTELLARMRAKGLPLPQKADRNTAGELSFARNRAVAARREATGSVALPGDVTQHPDEALDDHIQELSSAPAAGASGSMGDMPLTAESVDQDVDDHIRALSEGSGEAR